jgi:hypothetical protein
MYTYFIQGASHTPVKIGKANDVSKRLIALQTSHYEELRVLLVLEGDREAELHLRFSADRIRGEWFRWSHEIEAFVTSHLPVPAIAWQLVRLHGTLEQQQQFDNWRSKCWLMADALVDYVQYRVTQHGCRDLPEARQLRDAINMPATFLEQYH